MTANTNTTQPIADNAALSPSHKIFCNVTATHVVSHEPLGRDPRTWSPTQPALSPSHKIFCNVTAPHVVSHELLGSDPRTWSPTRPLDIGNPEPKS